MADLSGLWSLVDDTGTVAVAMALPGDGITALQKAGAIPDPYFGRNEYDCRWISERDWIARRSFDHDGSASVLVIDGLDTIAEVRLNGTLVLSAANAHRRWRVDVTPAPGQNQIEITFRSPVRVAADLQAGMPFYVPYQAVNGPIPNANMLRKPQCDFGWDWNIALGQFGLWGAIRLEPAGPRIGDVLVGQRHTPGQAEVFLRVQSTDIRVTATLCGVTATAPVVDGVAEIVLVLADPVLWWPAGLGSQSLHDLTLQSGGAMATRRIGLRSLEHVSAPDAAGRSFLFRVNGHDTFAKGANWIPADALHGRITRDGVRDLLQSAVDAHMNMIRVWGGGRYEPDWFYDLCDEMGLMVWQDFMFSCHLYPSTPAFLAEVDAEVRDVVGRIGYHACLALWCGDNELIGALTWFPESRKDRDRYLVSYDRLNRTIETALRDTAPDANWWPSSPSPGPLSFGDAWHDDSSGDMHFWSVWHEGRDFDHYRDVSPRFCSEFGFQSYPSMDAVRTFADPVDFNIAAPVMESHQKNAGGNARIAETMFRYFRFPSTFEDFVWLSQVQQGLAIKTAVTDWRAKKPHCQGTLIWQLNDTWPCCSWSSLNYGGSWKLLHHMAKAFYAPVYVAAVPRDSGFDLIGINDRREPVDLTVTAYATSMDGTAREIGRGGQSVGASAVVLLTIPASALKPDEVLTYGWVGSDGTQAGDIANPRPWKSYDLPDPGLTFSETKSGASHVLTVTARAMAFFVTPEADCPGRWDRAALHCGPGPEFRFAFVPTDPGARPTFRLRNLHSATCAQI